MDRRTLLTGLLASSGGAVLSACAPRCVKSSVAADAPAPMEPIATLVTRWDRDAHLLGFDGPRRGWFAEWVNLVPLVGQPVLLGFNAGSVAEEMEGWTDEALVDAAMDALRNMYG